MFSMKNLTITGEQEAVETTPYASQLDAIEDNGTQQLIWSNNIESEGYQFEIQYATDSAALISGEFEILSSVTGNGINETGWTYEQLIESLDPATEYFFRVESTNNNQEKYYTNIVKLTTPSIPVVMAEKFDVTLQNLVDTDINYSLALPTRLRVGVRLLSSSGALVYQSNETYDGGMHNVVIPESVIPNNGMYFMEVSTAAESISRKIVVQ